MDNDVRSLIIDTFQSLFDARSYELQKAPYNPDTIVFTKKLHSLGYAHCVFSCSWYDYLETGNFTTALQRNQFDKNYRGRDQVDVVLEGYVPKHPLSPLPLVLESSFKDGIWKYSSEEDLRQVIIATFIRLENPILNWLEAPTSSQTSLLKKEWLIEPFRRFVKGELNTEQIVEILSIYYPKGFWPRTGEYYQDRLITEVYALLRHAVERSYANTRLPEPEHLYFILACLEGREEYIDDRF